MFRDLIADHRELLQHVSKARRAHGKLYRACADRQLLVAQVAALELMNEARRVYEYLEELVKL